MPWKLKKPCGHFGCPRLTNSKYCYEHAVIYKDERGTPAERGYDRKWRKARVFFLEAHPFCTKCKAEGKLIKADVVDHIVPHRGDEALFWDESNWQPLCKKCHDRKTRTEDQHQEYRY